MENPIKGHYESLCCGEVMNNLDVKSNFCPKCEQECSYVFSPHDVSLKLEQDNWLNQNPDNTNQLKLDL